MTFGKPQYNNVYSYNAESYNPNMESQYLWARYYNVSNGNFLTEDSYLGNITDPLTLNRYNYVKSSPLNYIDPSGHVAEYLTGGQSGQTNYYAPGMEIQNNKQSSDADTVCAQIADMINQNHGALVGGAAGVAIVVLTAPASVPTLAIMGAGAAGGAVGMMIGGLLHKGMDSAYIAHELKTKYGIDIAERQDLDLSSLPQEAQDLCGRFQENEDDMDTYFVAGQIAGAAGMVLYEAGVLLDAIGSRVVESSKNAFQKLKNWISNTFKGGK